MLLLLPKFADIQTFQMSQFTNYCYHISDPPFTHPKFTSSRSLTAFLPFSWWIIICTYSVPITTLTIPLVILVFPIYWSFDCRIVLDFSLFDTLFSVFSFLSCLFCLSKERKNVQENVMRRNIMKRNKLRWWIKSTDRDTQEGL